MRRNLFDILEQKQFDVVKEYKRVYTLFFLDKQVGISGSQTLFEVVYEKYRTLPPKLIRRTLSLIDFMEEYMCEIMEPPIWEHSTIDNEQRLEQFVSLCEFVYNFSAAVEEYVKKACQERTSYRGVSHINLTIRNIKSSMDEIGFQIVNKDGIYIMVNASPEVLAVSEIVKPELAVSVFEYNHFRMRGQLTEKLSILKRLADDLEPRRKELNEINKSLSSDLFQLFQYFVRHNHTEDEKYKALTANEIESWYDDIYQMYLLAKLQLDNKERGNRVREFLAN